MDKLSDLFIKQQQENQKKLKEELEKGDFYYHQEKQRKIKEGTYKEIIMNDEEE